MELGGGWLRSDVDPVSVNQTDLEERSQKVQRMGDIFRLADRVIAWVGPEADDSSCSLETFVSVGARIEVDWTLLTMRPATSEEVDRDWADVTGQPLLSKRQVLAINAFVFRPWFERLWVQQEVTLASHSMILTCGSAHIPWETFRNLMFALRLKPTPALFESVSRTYRSR